MKTRREAVVVKKDNQSSLFPQNSPESICAAGAEFPFQLRFLMKRL
jgi:hypothetical protein